MPYPAWGPFATLDRISALGPVWRRALIGLLLALALNQIGVVASPATERNEGSPAVFRGLVRDAQGPILGATVRIQTSDAFTSTDSAGSFVLIAREPAALTAWAPGYYIGGGLQHRPGDLDIEIVLEKHAGEDSPEYSWVSAYASGGEDANCENCHADSGNEASQLPFEQWQQDAHANSARNIRFLTMYSGTDIHGNQSPLTRYRQNRDYGKSPIRATVDESYFGPGYKLDFPTTAGNCATCHVPMASIDDAYGVDPSEVSGVSSEGIGCDFCHKISGVILDPATDLPFANRPGVLSFEVRRPALGHQYFAGPFDDVAPGEDVYSSLYSESRYCAPCHSAEFWDVTIYDSYGEWRRSSYADPGSLTTCQDCHMPASLNDHFARMDQGGRRRNPDVISSHRMPGAADEDLLRQAVTMIATAQRTRGEVEVRVDIVNDKTGHHVPTGSPLRQMILVVRAADESGISLPRLAGSVLPEWCGEGDPNEGYLAGLAGTAYAKILEEVWTGVSPSAAYWNPTRIVADNRLPAHGNDTTSYIFEAPLIGDVRVDVQLLYRRAFIQLRDWKGWDTADIEMAREIKILAAQGDLERIPPDFGPGR